MVIGNYSTIWIFH